jgi:chromosome segregation ATPase
MKRSFWLALVAMVAFSQPARAQQDDVARLRAELQRQQEVIGQLLKRLDELEKKQELTATNEELKEEAQTQQEAVESVRETLLGHVNLNGYSNFRFASDE